MKKILIAATIVSLVLVTLLTFGAIATFNYLEKSKPHLVVQQKIEKLQVHVNQVSNISIQHCWSKVESIFSNQLWLNFPIVNTIESLKLACLQKPTNDWAEQNNHAKLLLFYTKRGEYL